MEINTKEETKVEDGFEEIDNITHMHLLDIKEETDIDIKELMREEEDPLYNNIDEKQIDEITVEDTNISFMEYEALDQMDIKDILNSQLEPSSGGINYKLNKSGNYCNGKIKSNNNEDEVLKDSSSKEEIKTKMRYSCNQCDYHAAKPGTLQKHMKRHEVVRFSCNLCNYIARRKSSLKQHTKRLHKEVSYPCDECDYIATLPEYLKRHKSRMHERVRYPCDKCDYTCDNLISLELHTTRMHVSYPCDMCDYITKLPVSLENHKKRMHESVRYPCDTCDFTSKNPYDLKYHKSKQHESDQCDVHENHARKIQSLKHCKKRKQKRTRYQCNQCKYTEDKLFFVKCHIERKHKGGGYPLNLNEAAIKERRRKAKRDIEEEKKRNKALAQRLVELETELAEIKGKKMDSDRMLEKLEDELKNNKLLDCSAPERNQPCEPETLQRGSPPEIQ